MHDSYICPSIWDLNRSAHAEITQCPTNSESTSSGAHNNGTIRLVGDSGREYHIRYESSVIRSINARL